MQRPSYTLLGWIHLSASESGEGDAKKASLEEADRQFGIALKESGNKDLQVSDDHAVYYTVHVAVS